VAISLSNVRMNMVGSGKFAQEKRNPGKHAAWPGFWTPEGSRLPMEIGRRSVGGQFEELPGHVQIVMPGRNPDKATLAIASIA
jgi:hypothetical protein